MADDRKEVIDPIDASFDDVVGVIAPENNTIPKAEYGSDDTPLQIGEATLPCYVLEDERRVLTAQNMQDGMGIARGGSMKAGMSRLELFTSGKLIKPFISKDLADRVRSPIIFKLPNGGRAYGYEATILVDMCDAVLQARSEGALQKQQLGIASKCEALMRSLAKVGIIALVDEATGYQKKREGDALQRILDKFLSEEARTWSKTFPDEFWSKLVKIKGYDSLLALNRPAFVGHWVNDIVYDRLAPGIKAKLKTLNPRTKSGERKKKHHQHLTEEHGLPELKDHLKKVMVLMDASGNKAEFERLLNRSLPKYGDTLPMPLDEDQP